MSRVPVFAALVGGLAAGCASPGEHAAAADEQVYELLDARRSELFGDPAGFRVEPATDRLRNALLERPEELVADVRAFFHDLRG